MKESINKINRFYKRLRANVFYHKYKDYTMIPIETYVDNLILCESINHIDGCIVECGVWRGGMIAGIFDYLRKKRKCILFDSFEGLPIAQEIDGVAAKKWQKKNTNAGLDNCIAEIGFAEKAMKLAKSENYQIVKGWFDTTIPKTSINEPIAILRLDGDWYDSTLICLENLYPLVIDGGLIIVDDYYAWDGCARALHDYLSKNSLPLRIKQTKNNVCYIINSKEGRKY